MLPQHFHRRGATPPSREEVLALCEPADTGGHWYWLGDVGYEGIDPYAVIVRDGERWTALRILLPGVRVRHVNLCGLRTCVNPAHWMVVDFTSTVSVLTNFDGRGWKRAA